MFDRNNTPVLDLFAPEKALTPAQELDRLSLRPLEAPLSDRDQLAVIGLVAIAGDTSR